jgi:hypothetical protein
MSRTVKILVASAVVFLVAFAARHVFTPDVVPIAENADKPQPLWAVEVAFLLRATELTALFFALVVMLIVAGRSLATRLRRGA